MNLFFISIISLTAMQAVAQDRPNIVCIVSEDNTKDYMSLFCKGRGTETPNIEMLAEEGVLFNNAYSCGPVSSAARSTLISGFYGPRLGSHLHRGEVMVEMPKGYRMFPAYLRDAGYYTVNNAKEDYNIIKGDDVWDVSSRKGTWRDRKEGQPFFYVHNIADTHEGQMIKSHESLKMELGNYQPSEGVYLQKNYPNTELFRDAYRFYCKRIETMDQKVGNVIASLKKDSLWDNTIVFYYGDNGGIMPNSKGYLTEMGLNVPLIIRVPDKYRHLLNLKKGSCDDRSVCFADLAPTILQMAGVDVPKDMDGKSILDCRVGDPLFGYADRMGEKFDMVRSIRIGNYKYVRNFQPFYFDALSNDYRYQLPTYQELRRLYKAGKLNSAQSLFFMEKAPEMLYDLSVDEYECDNLVSNPSYEKILKKMRKELINWQLSIDDIGLFPEFYWVSNAGTASVEFASSRSKDIKRYLKIANFQLESFSDVEKSLMDALKSFDTIDRYWALTTCCFFKANAGVLKDQILKIAQSDKQAMNRARAVEYLALTKILDHKDVNTQMCAALYLTKDAIEATMILNSMTALMESDLEYEFFVDKNKLPASFLSHTLVKTALAKHIDLNY